MLRVKASVQQWLIPKNHHFMQVVHCSHTPKVNKLSLPETIHKRVRIDPIASTFDPVQVEKGWQEWWKDVVVTEKSNSTNADKKQKFTMILPPPNITGALHIGHALTITIQDALARWHRMRGFDVEWIPGLDHAGIATQVRYIFMV
jgi:valyl-tRNA synthetase